MDKKMLSIKEVAEFLNVSERSIFRYIHDGRLKATKIGYWRINEDDLQEFLNKNSNIKSTKTKK